MDLLLLWSLTYGSEMDFDILILNIIFFQNSSRTYLSLILRAKILCPRIGGKEIRFHVWFWSIVSKYWFRSSSFHPHDMTILSKSSSVIHHSTFFFSNFKLYIFRRKTKILPDERKLSDMTWKGNLTNKKWFISFLF